MKIAFALGVLTLPVLLNGCFSRCALKGDEKIDFYPTYGYRSPDQSSWVVPVKARLYEPHTAGRVEDTSLRLVRSLATLTSAGDELALLEERVQPFRARSREGRKLSLEAADETYKLPKSGESGEIRSELRLPASKVTANASPTGAQWTSYRLKGCESESETATGQAMLVEPQGISVITDIDDTIKVTGGSDKKALIQNTFFRPYKAVPGMASVFDRWKERGAQFHYFSMSPWQLFDPLAKFLTQEGFPQGVLHLREVKWKAAGMYPLAIIDNVAALLTAPSEVKTSEMEALMAQFPQRKFILLGDATGKDPEIFATLARRRKDQIQLIAIRDANPSANQERYSAVFADVPASLWKTFSGPSELPNEL